MQLKEGDVLINPVDSANPLIVASVTSDTALTLSVAVGSGDSYNGAITRKRIRLMNKHKLLQYSVKETMLKHILQMHM